MKIQYISAGLVTLALYVSGVTPTLAQTTNIAAQLEALLAQVRVLQAQIEQLENTSVSANNCISLSYNLYADQTDARTNGEVSKLQQFLAENASYTGPITGYFGPMTEAAVQRWQAARGIVSSGLPDTTGYGYVGPRTRAAMTCSSVGAPMATSFSTAPAQAQSEVPYAVTYATDVALARHRQYISPLSDCGNGNDFYDGGSGFDTLTYSGARSEFHITQYPDGGYIFKDLVPCRADIDTVINLEHFVFGDGAHTLNSLQPDRVEKTSVPTSPITQTESSGYMKPVAITKFSASPSSIGVTQSSSLTWNTINATRCTLQYGPYEEQVTVSGSKGVSPNQTTSYRLICTNDPGTGKEGPTTEKTISISVDALSCTLTATSPYDASGNRIPVTLTWTSSGAQSATAQYVTANSILPTMSLGTVQTNGTMTVNPAVTTDYTLTFTGSTGSKSCKTQVGLKG